MGCKPCIDKFRKSSEIGLEDLDKLESLKKIQRATRKFLIKKNLRKMCTIELKNLIAKDSNFKYIEPEKFFSKINLLELNYLSKLFQLNNSEKIHFDNFQSFFLSNYNSAYLPNFSKTFSNPQKSFLVKNPVKISFENLGKKPEYYWGNWNLSLEKHGFGIYLNSEGHLYIGNFKENKLNGFGIFIFNSNLENNFISSEKKGVNYIQINQKYFKDLIFTINDNENFSAFVNDNLTIFKGNFNKNVANCSGDFITGNSFRILFSRTKSLNRRISIHKGEMREDVLYM